MAEVWQVYVERAVVLSDINLSFLLRVREDQWIVSARISADRDEPTPSSRGEAVEGVVKVVGDLDADGSERSVV